MPEPRVGGTARGGIWPLVAAGPRGLLRDSCCHVPSQAPHVLPCPLLGCSLSSQTLVPLFSTTLGSYGGGPMTSEVRGADLGPRLGTGTPSGPGLI